MIVCLTELGNYGYWRWGVEDVSKQVNVTQPSPQSSEATVSQTDNGSHWDLRFSVILILLDSSRSFYSFLFVRSLVEISVICDTHQV